MTEAVLLVTVKSYFHVHVCQEIHDYIRYVGLHLPNPRLPHFLVCFWGLALIEDGGGGHKEDGEKIGSLYKLSVSQL